MISLTDLQHRFGFTRNETGVILFLSASLLAGAALRLFGPDAGPEPVPAFDYASSDSAFAALSSDTATAPPEAFRARKLPPASPVDINAAQAGELAQLPGIGPALARRIVESRLRAGPFTSVGDLLRVSGIGRKKLEKMRPYLVVR